MSRETRLTGSMAGDSGLWGLLPALCARSPGDGNYSLTIARSAGCLEVRASSAVSRRALILAVTSRA